MKNLNKYVKIVLISILEEPKSLAEIGKMWLGSRARLYYPTIIREIEKAVEDGLLIRKDILYEPNIPKLLDLVIKEISFEKQYEIEEDYKYKIKQFCFKIWFEDDKIDANYKYQLKQFYLTLGDFARRSYLSFEIVKQFTKLNPNKAEQLDLKSLIQLPVLLHFLREKDEETANVIMKAMGLEDYAKLIGKLEMQNSCILEKGRHVYDFVEYYKWLSKTLSRMQDKGLGVLSENLQVMKELDE